MRDAITYWFCNSCHVEFAVEEEPGYANLREAGNLYIKPVKHCPYCAASNIQPADD